MAHRILVVDDDPDIIHLVKTTLMIEGYEVITAKDGMTGTTHAMKYIPDLIILDVMMPKMSGFQTCKAIRSQPALKNIPVIFLTAKNSDKDKDWGEKMGCDYYITKPYRPDQLLDTIKEALKDCVPDESNREKFDPTKSDANWVD